MAVVMGAFPGLVHSGEWQAPGQPPRRPRGRFPGTWASAAERRVAELSARAGRRVANGPDRGHLREDGENLDVW